MLTDPASIAWLLNIRGGDLPFTPVALAFAILHGDARADLFIDPAKLDATVRAWLGNQVTCHPYAGLTDALRGLAGRLVRVDPAGAPAAIAPDPARLGCLGGGWPRPLPAAQGLQGRGGAGRRPRRAPPRRRGSVPLPALAGDGAGGDGDGPPPPGCSRSGEAVAGFRGESFPAISGAGEHGAVIHYRVTPESDRPIRPNEVYLIDSGGQFEDGTTDITRTVWTGPAAPPPELRARFTQVLRGNIALATTVFPYGVAGPHLDSIARRPLWSLGLDYDHGTGHGVGSYLSVHEGPVSLSRAAATVPLEAGMILSNEPGFYQPGGYGIRLETLLLVQPAEVGTTSTKRFLRFEVLTLAPFDRRLIDPALMEPGERAWLDAYHARVLATLSGQGGAELDRWLAQMCRPLEG